MRRIYWAWLFVGLFVGGAAGARDVIVETSGPITFNGGLFENHPVEGTQKLAASWTHSDRLFDVSIFVNIRGPASDTFKAYLVNMVGPGATVANQIATATLTGPGVNEANVRIFSGLELLPGTYYIVLAQSPGTIGWNGSTSATVTTGPGAFYNDSYLSGGAIFIPMGSSQTLLFRVEGTVVPDQDGDGIHDQFDNCPGTANPAQTDADHDGKGAACDTKELPTSQEDCTKDRWRSYDGTLRFRNQGECVAFVRKPPKKSPVKP